MRILLDESLPLQLRSELVGHSVRTVVQMKWRDKKNGELLQLASGEFDVFLTADQNMEYQQNLQLIRVNIIVLVAFNNRIQSLRPLVPEVLAVLEAIKPGQVIRIGG
jgi:predicted nuclease of predicted toxin-antitoxin system